MFAFLHQVNNSKVLEEDGTKAHYNLIFNLNKVLYL